MYYSMLIYIGWGKQVTGSGDHVMSEPEINYLVRAIGQRPNICGYNAFHTSGGILLRPSSVKSDDALHATDVWTWKEVIYTIKRTSTCIYCI